MVFRGSGWPSSVPGYKRDLLEDTKRWIILFPGDFYGGTRALKTTPMFPGTYKIVAKREPPRLTEDAKEKFRKSLEYPVLLDTVESRPAYIRVVR